MKKTLLLLTGLATHMLYAQDVKFSGYLDTFYSYDFSQPISTKQSFYTHHNRHNEVNINLAMLKASVDEQTHRASVALQAGTYANDNYTNEETTIKHIHEAYVGIPLFDDSVWLDMGLFGANFSLESVLGIDNPTLTRSLAAEASPYFLTGAKLTYTPHETVQAVIVLSNGWQRVQRVDASKPMAVGLQINYTPIKALSLSYGNFIGYETVDRLRHFHNTYAKYDVNDKLNLTASLDVGFEQSDIGSSTYNKWAIATLLGQYKFTPQYRMGARAEHVHDAHGSVISMNNVGFFTTGTSINFDYAPTPTVLWRAEVRHLTSYHEIFTNATSKHNTALTTSLAVKF